LDKGRPRPHRQQIEEQHQHVLEFAHPGHRFELHRVQGIQRENQRFRRFCVKGQRESLAFLVMGSEN
jgi:hypothetical protein